MSEAGLQSPWGEGKGFADRKTWPGSGEEEHLTYYYYYFLKPLYFTLQNLFGWISHKKMEGLPEVQNIPDVCISLDC